LGQLDSALSYYQKDLKISESLVSADPRNVGFQNGLAISYSKMGETYGSLGQLDSALSYYQQYQGLMKSLVSADPRNVGFQNGLAISYVKLGETFGSLGQLDSALSYYQKDLEISESLVSDDPRNVSFQNGLAISYVKLGEISVELGAYEEAEGYYKQAAAIWEKLVIIAPKYVEFQRFLSLIQERIQKLEDLPILILQYQIQQTQDTTQIYAYYAALVDTLRSRISQQPRYVEDLSQSLNSHAWYGLFLGAFTQAEALIQEAMALPYENVYLPINLAPALLFQGKKKEALKVYGSYRDQPFEVKTYADAFLDDMKAFEKAGIIPEAYKADVEEVKQLLSNP
ncbi:MAG: tetratricopeptide repeat protein, partial [Bacteroidota bacterium]